MNNIRRDDPLPLYKQVKNHLLDALRSGAIAPNSKLASERELTGELGVSRITVRQAMHELVMEGHLQSQPGKGFYATGRAHSGFELELLRSFTETARAHGKSPGSALISAGLHIPPTSIAATLGLSPGEPAISLRRLRLIDQQPVMIGHDWVPIGIAPDLLDLDWAAENRSLYAELSARYGVVPTHGQTVLSATLANAEECRLLNLGHPSAVLVVEQVAYDGAGRTINATYAIQNPAAYPLRLEQGGRR